MPPLISALRGRIQLVRLRRDRLDTARSFAFDSSSFKNGSGRLEPCGYAKPGVGLGVVLCPRYHGTVLKVDAAVWEALDMFQKHLW